MGEIIHHQSFMTGEVARLWLTIFFACNETFCHERKLMTDKKVKLQSGLFLLESVHFFQSPSPLLRRLLSLSSRRHPATNSSSSSSPSWSLSSILNTASDLSFAVSWNVTPAWPLACDIRCNYQDNLTTVCHHDMMTIIDRSFQTLENPWLSYMFPTISISSLQSIVP